MIKIKLGSLDGIMVSLKNVVSKDIPIKVSYRLSKLIKQIEDEYKTFTIQRNKIIEKYGEKDEKNNLVKASDHSIAIKPGLVDECKKDFDELNSIECEIDFSPVSIELLGDIQVKPQDFFVLNQFFTD